MNPRQQHRGDGRETDTNLHGAVTRKVFGISCVFLLSLLLLWRNATTTSPFVGTEFISQPQQPVSMSYSTSSSWSAPSTSSSSSTWPRVLEDGEIFHIVKTRFMQHQSHLLHLAMARLRLFETFCLPSMVHQQRLSRRGTGSDNYNDDDDKVVEFVWMISVDPQLPQPLLDDLVALLKPYSHFYLSFTTDNIKPGSGRHGIGDRILGATPHDVHVLQQNLDRWSDFVVLETQLDADDALHVQYIDTLQQRARQVFDVIPENNNDNNNHDTPNDGHSTINSNDVRILRDWMYWCIHRDLEWHWTYAPPTSTTNSDEVPDSNKYGILVPSRSFIEKQKCYTPGMTLGRNRNPQRPFLDVPHSLLVSTLLQKDNHQQPSTTSNRTLCGDAHAGIDCLDFVDNLEFPALRTRTPTSASMVGVSLPSSSSSSTTNQMEEQDTLWEKTHLSFGVDRETVQNTHQYFTKHMADIVRDAFQGQCSHGHSCREQAKESLKAWMKLYSQHNDDTG